MATRKTIGTALATKDALPIPTLSHFLSENKSFVPSYARVLAAISCMDKAVSPAELELLMDFARGSTSPALVGTIIFRTINDGTDLDDALADLSRSAKDATPEQRQAALTSAVGLLALQGPRANSLAKKLSKALRIPASTLSLTETGNWGLVDDVADGARRLFARGDLADAVIECGQSIGSLTLVADYRAYRKGQLTWEGLLDRVKALEDQISLLMPGGSNAKLLTESSESAAAALGSLATELRIQVEQRLALVDDRIAFARESFAEDIEDLVNDAGNSIERGITDRLMTDDWKKPQVWESIARTQFGQDAERRIGRAIRRLDEGLHLLNEDLRLFEAQVRVAHRTIFHTEHHARLEALMPPLRLGTRAVNTIDSLATGTLSAGAAAAAGAGAAAYLLGPAVVLPLISPALPYIGGALLVAGLFKWLKSPDERRKYAEIRDKRRAFEKLVRDRLTDAQTRHNAELERIRADFRAAANNLLTPIALEAEAAQQLPRLRQGLLNKAIDRANASFASLRTQLREIDSGKNSPN